VIGRGLWAGALYGAAYGAVEALGAVIIFEWLGAGAGILRIVEGELVSLLVQYVLLGVAVGVLVAPAVAATERFLPPRWRGPGINFQLLGLAFIAIAFCWNPDSVLPRRFYVVAAFGAGADPVGIPGCPAAPPPPPSLAAAGPRRRRRNRDRPRGGAPSTERAARAGEALPAPWDPTSC
jgi:hypothetical protein